jgi:hypothetical protein
MEIIMKNGLIVNEFGSKCYYLNDSLHRENGPAWINQNGDKEWRIHGKLHREDGPAVERADGCNAYYINGKLHREDGPAIEYANGNKSYWINDIVFCKQDYWNEIKRRKSLKFIIKNYISSI